MRKKPNDIEEVIGRLCSFHLKKMKMKYDPSGESWLPDDDLFQAGYVAGLEAFQRFDPDLGNKFVTYAYPCIEGQMKDELKRFLKHRAIGSVDVDKEDVSGDIYPELREDPNDFIKDVENAMDVESCLGILDDDQRDVITRVFLEGMTQEAVARELGLSTSTISRLKLSALDRMRAVFGDR